MFFCSLGVLLSSTAGSMLSLALHSLLLLPGYVVQPLLACCLSLLPRMDRLNRLLPAAALLEEQELEWPVQGERFKERTDGRTDGRTDEGRGGGDE